MVLRRLIRSLPTRDMACIGVATCDKGLPAMMMALAGTPDLPCVLVPGGVTLPPDEGEDAGKVQSIGARFAHGEIRLAGSRDPRLPGLRLTGRRLPVPRHRGHLASGRRGAGPRAAPLAPSRLPARPSGWRWRGPRRAPRCGCASAGSPREIS